VLEFMQRCFRYFLIYCRILFLKVCSFFLGIEIVNASLLKSTFGASRILKSFGASIGRQPVIHGPLIIHNAVKDYANLKVGTNVHIGRNVFLDLSDSITIGDHAVISMNCTLLTHQDVGNRPLQSVYPRVIKQLRIGRNAYLGTGVTLLAGSSIGESSVVGAGAVVDRPVSDRQVVAGIPAKVIKKLSDI